MQRAPIFGGQISALQLKTLAELAIEFTQSSPLHLTTRQNIELHNIPPEHLNTIQERLHAIDLPTFGAGGDSLRNITVCPCCHFDSSAYDVQLLADLVKKSLHNHGLLNTMSRKFKISFAGCKHPKSKPFINDLSFIAISETAVRVIGTGSLGASPKPGIILFEQLPIEDVLPLTIASLKFFVEHGDRENRRKARFRHIRQRMGDGPFLEMLNEYFRKEKESRVWPTLELKKGLTGWDHHAILQAVNRNLNVQDALLLAQIMTEQNAQIRINLTHGIDIFSKEPLRLPAELELLTNLPCIVTCPGSTTCKNGLTNCPQLATELADALKGNNKLKGKTIALSGCPNNCTHSSVADIGLSGMLKTIDGIQQEVYQVLLGGDSGITDKLAERDRIVTADKLAEYLLGL